MIDDRFRLRWQHQRAERWVPDDLSHEAYEAWWRENRHPGDSYSLADHVEKHMSIAGEGSYCWLREHRTLFGVYDFLRCRYGPLLAAEAFRRWLQGLAERTTDCSSLGNME